MQSERRDEKGSADLDVDERGRKVYKTGEWSGSYANPSRWHDNSAAGGGAAAGAAGALLSVSLLTCIGWVYRAPLCMCCVHAATAVGAAAGPAGLSHG